MKASNFKRFAPLFILTSLMVGLWFFIPPEYLKLETLKDQRETLLSFTQDNMILSSIGYIFLYITAVAFSLPLATVITLMGGFLFGLWLGTLYVAIGATIGASILFLIARSALGDTLRNKAKGLYERIEKLMNGNEVSYLLFMRLVPLFPFFLVNIVPAFFPISLRHYVLATFFGILPGTFVYVNLGQNLASIDSLSGLISLQMLLAFTLLGIFAMLPVIYRHFKNKRKTAG